MIRETIFPVERYSSSDKLFRVTALVLKFIDKLRRKVKPDLDYRYEAETYWIRQEQLKYLDSEIRFLTTRDRSEVPNLVKNLNSFLDDNQLLRSRGRLAQSKNHNYDENNPILLPRNSFLTCLIIEDVHSRCKHLGVATTLVRLRAAGFWVPKGRMTVKSVLSRCILCKKINGYAFRYPTTTDYIKDKVNFISAFQHTGVDYTGHVFVKLGDNVHKMYILLFTCLNTRAIHLELLPDLTCQNFLLSFIRFCNLLRHPFGCLFRQCKHFPASNGDIGRVQF